MTMESKSYPVTLRGELTIPPGRWVWIFKWLLAIPHYIVTGFFAAGYGFGRFGLVFALSIIAAVALLFTGKYPPDIFKLVIGMNRWVYRVSAYASLMRDEYPPFRLWDD